MITVNLDRVGIAVANAFGDEVSESVVDIIRKYSETPPSNNLRVRILDIYGQYDSDPRVNGPDDFDAFYDAVTSVIPSHEAICNAIQEHTKYSTVWSDRDEDVDCWDCDVEAASNAVLAVITGLIL